jgi:hypothetical protein
MATHRLYYLDAIEEHGSSAILNELKILVHDPAPSAPACFTTHHILSRNHLLTKERKSSTHVHYFIHKGEVNLDIRDSGDCWLRICLSPGQLVEIPSDQYHKFSSETFHHIEISYQTPGGVGAEPVEGSSFICRYLEECDSLKAIPRHQYRELICELCSHFYNAGWVTGTGGSISIRYGNRIFMTPSGVQKERILPDELFMLDIAGNHLSTPAQKIPGKFPKLSDCSPLFLHAYRLRNAGLAPIDFL